LLGLVSGLEADLFRPPVVERRHRDNGKVIHFHGISIFRRPVLQSLHEREKVNADSAFPQSIEDRLWIVQKSPFLSIDAGDSN
jgi:hypothetical protein